ncbi:MAG: histidine kinase dimerization/phospho-acceptor domain-containing protein, partial [bacterium]
LAHIVGIAFVILLFMAFLIANFINRNVSIIKNKLERLFNKILHGDFSKRIDKDSVNIDYQELVENINKMLNKYEKELEHKRELEKQISHQQKMDAIGTLASGIAHDFNNILTHTYTYCYILLDQIDKNDPRRDHVDSLLQANERATSLVSQILNFGRASKGSHTVAVDLIAKEVVKLLKATLPKAINIKADIKKDILLDIDPIHFHQIVLNLCTNA